MQLDARSLARDLFWRTLSAMTRWRPGFDLRMRACGGDILRRALEGNRSLLFCTAHFGLTLAVFGIRRLRRVWSPTAADRISPDLFHLARRTAADVTFLRADLGDDGAIAINVHRPRRDRDQASDVGIQGTRATSMPSSANSLACLSEASP